MANSRPPRWSNGQSERCQRRVKTNPVSTGGFQCLSQHL